MFEYIIMPFWTEMKYHFLSQSTLFIKSSWIPKYHLLVRNFSFRWESCSSEKMSLSLFIFTPLCFLRISFMILATAVEKCWCAIWTDYISFTMYYSKGLQWKLYSLTHAASNGDLRSKKCYNSEIQIIISTLSTEKWSCVFLTFFSSVLFFSSVFTAIQQV